MEKNKNDIEYSSIRKPEKDRFPRIVILIVLAEFCERFSYSGMKAFLTLYLRSKLDFTDDGATEIYHVFSMLVYVFPVMGGILADNYLGKFRTILYMMFVYASGNILVAVAAVPGLALPVRLCTMLGLLMITVGTGGIKPCVTAFGGDQFQLPRQQKHLAIYFSVLYCTLSAGSLIAKTVSPILRAEVHCFGDKDCYSLAFGAPGLVVIMSIVIFVSAKKKYVMKKPEGNVVFDFVKCVSLGIKDCALRGCGRGRAASGADWLSGAEVRFGSAFVQDVRKTLSILSLFAVLPVFWSLLDQLGSRWTLQATKMDGRMWFVNVKPDQIQVTGPIFILIIIPIFQKYLYPSLEKRGVLTNPLHKLTVGGVLAGIAFIVSGCLELYLQTTYPELPKPGHAQLRVFNSHPHPVTLHGDLENTTHSIPPLSHLVRKDVVVRGGRAVGFRVTGAAGAEAASRVLLTERVATSCFLQGGGMLCYEDDVDKSRTGFPVVRFLVAENLRHLNLSLYNENRDEVELYIEPGISDRRPVFASGYSVRESGNVILSDLRIQSGGVYALLVNRDLRGRVNASLITISAANSVSMALLLPQFLIISVAEVLFAVTGNEFAFKESPASMRAVMTAAWLLTESAGNIIIIAVTRLCARHSQATQFFIYTAMMFVSIAVFHFLSRGYRFREQAPPRDPHPPARRTSELLYVTDKQTSLDQ